MFSLKFFSSDEDSENDLPLIFLGGSSFIGLNTAQTLFYYYDIYCTYYNSKSPQFFPEFIWSRINFLETRTNRRLLTNLIKRSQAKIIINFTNFPPSESMKNSPNNLKIVNIELNNTIIDLCNKFEVFPIFISSDHVFSGHDGPYSEDISPEPLSGSFYGNQKYSIEKLYFQNSKSFAIIRLSSILGLNLHFQRENVYSKVLSAIKNKKEIKGATNKFRTPSHVYNISFLLHKLIDNLKDSKFPSKINLHLPGEYISEYDLFKEIAISHNCNDNLIIPYEIDDSKNAYPLNLGLESKKTVKLVNARYLNLREGLQILNSEIESTLKT